MNRRVFVMCCHIHMLKGHGLSPDEAAKRVQNVWSKKIQGDGDRVIVLNTKGDMSTASTRRRWHGLGYMTMSCIFGLIQERI